MHVWPNVDYVKPARWRWRDFIYKSRVYEPISIKSKFSKVLFLLWLKFKNELG